MEFKDTESQLAGIEKIFAEARSEDNWKTGKDMLYSYYFVDTDAEKLDALGESLEENGYDFIGVYELGDEQTDAATGEYMLHIDKIETHTPESLAQRNVEFARLAEEFGIKTYDGWEFGEEGDYDDDEGGDEETEIESPS